MTEVEVLDFIQILALLRLDQPRKGTVEAMHSPSRALL